MFQFQPPIWHEVIIMCRARDTSHSGTSNHCANQKQFLPTSRRQGACHEIQKWDAREKPSRMMASTLGIGQQAPPASLSMVVPSVPAGHQILGNEEQALRWSRKY
jgi:hypothetical protein